MNRLNSVRCLHLIIPSSTSRKLQMKERDSPPVIDPTHLRNPRKLLPHPPSSAPLLETASSEQTKSCPVHTPSTPHGSTPAPASARAAAVSIAAVRYPWKASRVEAAAPVKETGGDVVWLVEELQWRKGYVSGVLWRGRFYQRKGNDRRRWGGLRNHTCWNF